MALPSLLSWLLRGAVAAPCPEGLLAEYAALERGPADLSERLAEADRQFACLGPLSPADAAVVHRAHAMAAFLSRDRAGTEEAFTAAVRADPAWLPDPDVIPPGHPLDLAVMQARLAPRAAPVTLPARALVDGVLTREVPADAPATVQFVRGGRVRVATYHRPGEPWPEAPRSGTPWVVGAGLGVASGVLWGLALRDLAAYEARTAEPLVGDARLEAAAVGERANLLGGLATGTSVLTAGALGFAIVRAF